jgi:hypothetical protein
LYDNKKLFPQVFLFSDESWFGYGYHSAKDTAIEMEVLHHENKSPDGCIALVISDLPWLRGVL